MRVDGGCVKHHEESWQLTFQAIVLSQSKTRKEKNINYRRNIIDDIKWDTLK